MLQQPHSAHAPAGACKPHSNARRRSRRCMDAAASRSTLAAALRPAGVRKASTITSISLQGGQQGCGSRQVARGPVPNGWARARQVGQVGTGCHRRRCGSQQPATGTNATDTPAQQQAHQHGSSAGAAAHSLVNGKDECEQIEAQLHHLALLAWPNLQAGGEASERPGGAPLQAAAAGAALPSLRGPDRAQPGAHDFRLPAGRFLSHLPGAAAA